MRNCNAVRLPSQAIASRLGHAELSIVECDDTDLCCVTLVERANAGSDATTVCADILACVGQASEGSPGHQALESR